MGRYLWEHEVQAEQVVVHELGPNRTSLKETGMAILRTITFCVIAAASPHALAGACTTPVLGALAHEPDGVYVVRKTTPDNIEAQCGSAVDSCIIHKGGTDFILIRNDLSAANYQCALLHQYAVINAKQI